MRPLSEQDIISIWETGRRQHPVDRALTILLAAQVADTRGDLAKLSIGTRDGILFDLRELTFGPTISACSECPECAEKAEFALQTSDLRVSPHQGPAGRTPPVELAWGDAVLGIRLPDSTDLAAASACDSVEAARELIARRCIIHPEQGPVPPEVIEKLSERVAELDPQADVLLDLTCPACGRRWQAAFDIAALLWREISARAKQTLWDVHALASAYGWREAEILAMSPARRQLYLEMVS